MSDVCRLMSDVWRLMIYVRYQSCDVWCLVRQRTSSEVWNLTSDNKHQTYVIPSVIYLVISVISVPQPRKQISLAIYVPLPLKYTSLINCCVSPTIYSQRKSQVVSAVWQLCLSPSTCNNIRPVFTTDPLSRVISSITMELSHIIKAN